MSAAFELRYHAPPAHNERVKVLIKKFQIKLDKAHGERNEIIWNEDQGRGVLCPSDEARCSDLYLQIQDHARTIEQLNNLILPVEN
jgi:hypothetical protein